MLSGVPRIIADAVEAILTSPFPYSDKYCCMNFRLKISGRALVKNLGSECTMNIGQQNMNLPRRDLFMARKKLLWVQVTSVWRVRDGFEHPLSEFWHHSEATLARIDVFQTFEDALGVAAQLNLLVLVVE